MKCQILFSGKNKKNIINLSSAENAQRLVKVKNNNNNCQQITKTMIFVCVYGKGEVNINSWYRKKQVEIAF